MYGIYQVRKIRRENISEITFCPGGSVSIIYKCGKSDLMNKQEQLEYFNQFVQEMRQTMIAKGDDYAGEDRLANFKHAGTISRIGATRQVLSLIATKVARLGQLLESGEAPRNEATKDSILDLANYSLLLAMVIEDEQRKRMEFPLTSAC